MANSEPDKVVTITINPKGLPIPDQDPVQIKKDAQKVRWVADFDFEIVVDGYSDVTRVVGGSKGACHVTSGNFRDARRYKYSIIANGVTNDPDVDVKP